MSNIELKPCPFCGGKARLFTNHHKVFGDYSFVTCDECRIYTKHCDTVKEATEIWNRRANLKDGDNDGQS